MKLASYRHGNEVGFGIVTGGGLIDLGKRLGTGVRSLKGLIAANRMDEAREIAAAISPDYGLDDIAFLPPVTGPDKIVCIGVNYVDRNEEYKDGSAPPEFPSVFMRTRESLVGHGQALVRPPESEQLDYEGEIAIIIGKEGRRIAEDRAHEHIAGLSVVNEGSIRDWLRHARFNVTQGKNFERSGAFGPWMVTADEIPDYENLWVTTRVNGEQRQHDTTANLLFDFRYLIHYLSTFMRLKPGDVISTGTPNGAGARFDPPRYLKPGDVVEVDVPGVGTLVNPVVDE
jgi:2-keto-4-pentenoate hydratase/2-oxohepta-3-ene-1,7-dioic acid hydratase in catechol pathway